MPCSFKRWRIVWAAKRHYDRQGITPPASFGEVI